MTSAWLVPLLLSQSGNVSVHFQVNDAMFKDRVVAGVGIGIAATKDGPNLTSGRTDEAGRFECRLEPGNYFVTYRRELYVPIERTPTTIATDGQVITTTMSMLMEAEGRASEQRVQIILNWGSDQDRHARDVDSHLVCPCGGGHVYFASQNHKDHRISLDVDDMDWGGPETITLIDPDPGEYVYWVHNYSGSPPLARSQILVRVLFNDRVAGEYPIPTGGVDDDWRPFHMVVIDDVREARVVDFSPEEIAAGAHLEVPEPAPDVDAFAFFLAACVATTVVVVFAFLVIRARKR